MKKRNINNYIEILTYIWLKWINNHELANDVNTSLEKRKLSGARCEKLQRIRQRIIININELFDEKIQ